MCPIILYCISDIASVLDVHLNFNKQTPVFVCHCRCCWLEQTKSMSGSNLYLWNNTRCPYGMSVGRTIFSINSLLSGQITPFEVHVLSHRVPLVHMAVLGTIDCLTLGLQGDIGKKISVKRRKRLFLWQSLHENKPFCCRDMVLVCLFFCLA